MVLWGPVLGVLLVVIAGYLCLPGLFRQQRPHEPPLDKGPWPWLGHVIPFRKNMFEFLKHMRAKHGDVFTVQLGGQYFTFVMDPLSFGPILKDVERKLDFVQYAEELVLKVFGYSAGQGDHQMIRSASTKYLMGDGLKDLNKAMLNCLSLVMLGPTGRSRGADRWQEDSLFHFCYRILFKAGFLSLFGCTEDKEQDLLQAEELFVQFRKFDLLFPRFVYSLLWPREWLAVGQLQQLFHKMLSVEHFPERDGVSSWIHYMLRHLREGGVTPAMQDKFNFMMLWASQGNTGPTSFWALLFLLKHPEAMQAVREEATQVLREARLEANQYFVFELSALQCTPVLDSVIQETLRLGAAPTLYRRVHEDYTLKTASEKEYLFRHGDVVALFPYLSVHMDPEIHPDPTAFKYNRFLNPNGSRKVDFYKAGKKIHHYTMPWGAGVSVCPGRFFAFSEMKLFVLLMVRYFDLELVDPDTPVPPMDPQRWGFGTIQPSHSVRFRYRLQPTE
ncbi:5-beta-cholestane-3-alpha,7-alpha-diol 12-alpha-hydroxylase [Tupaia chinensis]|uniref:7-alpha-hydroxycholest-4-en-3-one 12-alpha-hydroxylase n=1 Tax=Tupaia chinensis TaxID=246437 RepID=L9KA25_TUPCH|nr:5-beta-cholestane-3-alpha,7-alpha-diol 12-alpha-hydroxylase [Tupaia chinensis]ELW58282.1 7-alpha-hydroxycholest-4-en-3-one 12-alpha-hydroxylase [Tupaia chinensis]